MEMVRPMETTQGRVGNLANHVFPTGEKIYSWFSLNILEFLSGV